MQDIMHKMYIIIEINLFNCAESAANARQRQEYIKTRKKI